VAQSAARPIRLLRLDRPDGRDATFCLWLSAQVLGDANLRRRAEAAVEELSALRIADEKSPARNLWAPAYNLDESPLQDVNDLPYGVDTAATDYAMQSLLAASLLGDADAAAPVLEEATAALNRLPRRDGQWLHDYGLTPAAPTDASGEGEGKEALERANQGPDAPPESQVFVPGSDGEKKGEPAAPPSLAQTVAAAKRLAELGPQKYAEALAAAVPVEHRLALAVCGLDEDALTREVPTDAKGIEQYMQRYRGPFSLLDSPPPDDLATRVQRLGLLLRLVRIESGSNHHDH
jgi:hypothetical protein